MLTPSRADTRQQKTGASLTRAALYDGKVEKTEFIAITEMELRPEENKRHQFISGLFKEKEISLVPLSRLPVWAHQLRPMLQ